MPFVEDAPRVLELRQPVLGTADPTCDANQLGTEVVRPAAGKIPLDELEPVPPY